MSEDGLVEICIKVLVAQRATRDRLRVVVGSRQRRDPKEGRVVDADGVSVKTSLGAAFARIRIESKHDDARRCRADRAPRRYADAQTLDESLVVLTGCGVAGAGVA